MYAPRDLAFRISEENSDKASIAITISRMFLERLAGVMPLVGP